MTSLSTTERRQTLAALLVAIPATVGVLFASVAMASFVV